MTITTQVRDRRTKAGQVLFVIDPRPFQAAVNKAAADLQEHGRGHPRRP